ncbi:hypothetical protein M0R45_032867 [Rubus argutus]|uniref:Uncharacterized protein n=1 Tax=Rubus argutus TaxID=59490 RepID=A0AAW1WKR0_RUBAR
MATLGDIGVAAAINILTACAFFVAFAILRLQPVNDRVYFPKWYLKGLRASPLGGAFNPELIDHAGLDSAVYLRIYLTGLKIFFTATWMNSLFQMFPLGSHRFWTHLVMAYAFYILDMLCIEKGTDVIGKLPLMHSSQTNIYLGGLGSRVLVRNVPPDPDEQSVSLWNIFFLLTTRSLSHSSVDEKKKVQNWLDYYQLKFSRNSSKRPLTKTGFLGLLGKRVDGIDFYTSEVERLSKEISLERDKITNNTKSIMPSAFVSFNLDGVLLRLIVAVAFFFLTFFFMIPIAFVQSLANIEGIERAAPFLKTIVEVKFIKSFIQGFLPGIALKIFLIFLPSILMVMSKFEGFTSISALERRSATRYYIFQFINVFLGSIITGTAFQQLDKFIHQSANDIPITIGVSIPMKATFFITYIMTEKDREEAMDPGTLGFNTGEPQIQLYFLLGLVYAVVSPILLPFIIVFFGLAYVVYRHQIINVYNQEYESAAAFWPDVHGRIITALIVSQLLLMGLLSTKEAAQSTPLLITLPVLTIWFHLFCKGRYEPAFKKNPLQEAMRKDTLERVREPTLNLKGFLQSAYIHPVFKGADDTIVMEPLKSWSRPVVVPTKRQSRRNTHRWPANSGSVHRPKPKMC